MLRLERSSRTNNNELEFGFADPPLAVLDVESYGPDTGSNKDYFNIGQETFPTIEFAGNVSGSESGPAVLFDFDWKITLHYKIEGTNGFRFNMIDKDKFSKDGT